MGTPLVQGCDSADVDATTGACAHPYWVEQQTFLPSLSAGQGTLVGVAILTCWATAYAWKSLGRLAKD